MRTDSDSVEVDFEQLLFAPVTDLTPQAVGDVILQMQLQIDAKLKEAPTVEKYIKRRILDHTVKFVPLANHKLVIAHIGFIFKRPISAKAADLVEQYVNLIVESIHAPYEHLIEQAIAWADAQPDTIPA